MIKMAPCDNPRCPRCGCEDSQVLRYPPVGAEGTWWGLSGKAACKHCGLRFDFVQRKDAPRAPVTEIDDRAEQVAPELSRSAVDTVARYYVYLCGKCQKPSLKVTSAPAAGPSGERVRHHVCKDCGATFKSVETRVVWAADDSDPPPATVAATPGKTNGRRQQPAPQAAVSPGRVFIPRVA